MPELRDVINYYMRDLTQEDFIGSATMYYLRQEILMRVNKIVYPAVVKNILFNEIVRT